ncbi:MAG: S-layer homology domain-containing protein [Acidobacteriota bacterium]
MSRYVYRTAGHPILNVSVDKAELPLALDLQMPMRVDNMPDDTYQQVVDVFQADEYPRMSEAFPMLLLMEESDNSSGLQHKWIAGSATGSNKYINASYLSGDELNPNMSLGTYGVTYCSTGDYHNGEDWNVVAGGDRELIVGGVNVDEKLFAIGDGVVIYADYNSPEEDPIGGSRGCSSSHTPASVGILHKILDPESGAEDYLVSEYWHAMNVSVRPGQRVTEGQFVAEVGRCGTGIAHLHFQMMKSSMLDLRASKIVLRNKATYWPPAVHRCSADVFIGNNYYEPAKFIERYSKVPLVELVRLVADYGSAGRLLEIRGWNFTADGASIPVVELYREYGHSTGEVVAGTSITSATNRQIWLHVPATFEDGLLKTEGAGLVVDNGFARSALVGVPFHDVFFFDWFEGDVVDLWTRGIAKGRSQRFYEPDGTINRIEFLTLVVRSLEAAGLGPTMTPSIPSPGPIVNEWYFPTILWAYGYENPNNGFEKLAFWPLSDLRDPASWGREITRYEAARIAMNAKQLGGATPDCDVFVTPLPGCLQAFSDVAVGSPHAAPVYACRLHGIIDGYSDNTFRGNNSINRAEAARIIRSAFF